MTKTRGLELDLNILKFLTFHYLLEYVDSQRTYVQYSSIHLWLVCSESYLTMLLSILILLV